MAYDLLTHGYRLEWLGTARLPFRDALVILTQQPPATSAVYRELHPEDFDRGAVTNRLEALTQRVELLCVIATQTQIRLGQWVDGSPSLPRTFDDLLAKPKPAPDRLFSLDEIDRLVGGQSPRPEVQP